jgi:hypothetical protein
MNNNTILIKIILLFSLLTVLAVGFSSISYADNSNTFTFTNNGITALDSKGSGYKIEENSLTINEAGTYTITGSCSEGSIKVKKETMGVTLVLKDLSLSCSTSAPISLNKSTETTIEVLGTVTLADKEDTSLEDTSEDFEGACIKVKSGATLKIKGNGTLNLDSTSCKNGIKGAATSKVTIDGNATFNIKSANSGIAVDGSMVINGGTFNVEAEDAIKCDPDDDDTESLGDLTINGGTYKIKSSSDGVRANGKLEINGGTFDITSAEALEGTYVLINDGNITISASDDGINASNKSNRYSPKVEINGGNITIAMGQGDTDAVDANGELIITGGALNITARSAFDYDSKVTFTGGDVTVNGEKITTISNQMMGGRMGMQGFGGERMSQDFNRQNGRIMSSGDFRGQKQGRQNMNGQNAGRMTPPEMNNQNGAQMVPPEMRGNNGTQMVPPELPNEETKNTRPNKWRNASSWAEEELTKADEKQLIPESLVGADYTEPITREEFAHIIIKLYEAITGKIVAEVKDNPFTDTSDSEVLKAYSLGITNGTTKTTFSPKNLITREEMATMMTRALEKAGVATSQSSSKMKFDDDNDMHDWGRDSIYFMANNDIIQGVGNNKFNVKGNASKEQALLISERSLEKFGQ